MRRLGRTRARTTTTASATAATLVALAVLLAGCGGGDDGDPPQGGGDPSSSASPSPDPTPSELQGGTTVDGPAFTFTVAPGYELQNQYNDQDQGGKWLRSYALDVFSAFSVGYRSSEYLPLKGQLAAVRNYLIGRGTSQIERVEDLTLLGHDTAHLVGRSQYKVVHGYIVQLDGHYLQIFVERKPGDTEQEAIQQAMIDSLRLTG